MLREHNADPSIKCALGDNALHEAAKGTYIGITFGRSRQIFSNFKPNFFGFFRRIVLPKIHNERPRITWTFVDTDYFSRTVP